MPKTVLIIDDDPQFVLKLAKVLQDDGFRTMAAATGAEALNRLDRDHDSIDAVIVDLNLPEISGFEVIGALTRRKNLMSIMATTAVYGDTYLEIAKQLGAHVALRKPAADSQLKEWSKAVHSVLRAEDDLGSTALSPE
jgi:two-component system, OmpR family, response regulator